MLSIMKERGSFPFAALARGATVCSSHRELQLAHSKPHPHNQQGNKNRRQGRQGCLRCIFLLLSLLSIAGDVNKGAEVDSSLATD